MKPKKGNNNALLRKHVRGRSKRVAQERATPPASAVAQEDQQAGAVEVVLDNTVPGGFRLEPVDAR